MSWRPLVLWMLAPIAAGLVLAGVAALLPTPWRPEERLTAVLLVDGQAYFGHALDLPWSDTVELTDVYYFQDARTSSTDLPLALVKRGGELHQPTDGMTFRRDKILAIEALRADSPVRAAIMVDRAFAQTGR